MRYTAGYNTDIGIRKDTNQDSLAVRVVDTAEGQIAFMLVCDGMGGLSKGELASKDVTEAFCRWFDRELLYQITSGRFSVAGLRSDWNSIIQNENRLLGNYGLEHGIMLGTTVTGMLIYRDEYYIVHVGDSRAYEIKDGASVLTTDQTFVAREVALGHMTEEQAQTDSRRSVLLQCVGASERVEPEFIKGQVKRDTVYMVCSDGFRHKISPEEIERKLGPDAVRSEKDITKGCMFLTELVKTRKETDNITVVALRVGD